MSYSQVFANKPLYRFFFPEAIKYNNIYFEKRRSSHFPHSHPPFAMQMPDRLSHMTRSDMTITPPLTSNDNIKVRRLFTLSLIYL